MKTAYLNITRARLSLLSRPEEVSLSSSLLTVKLLMFVLLLFAALMWEGNSDTLFVCQIIGENRSGWITRHITSLPTSSNTAKILFIMLAALLLLVKR